MRKIPIFVSEQITSVMNHLQTYLTLGLLCLFAVNDAEAQTFVTRTLPTQSQLPIASIHCILQDREGYMWYGTEKAGVCRDNGYQIDVFQPSSSGSNRQNACSISCLAEDGRERIIVGTKDGLFYIDKHNYSIGHIKGKPADTYIDALHIDKKGRQVWFATRGCIAVTDTTDSIIARYPFHIGGKTTSVARLQEDSKGTMFALLWPAADGGRPEILCKTKNGKDFVPLGWPLPNTPIQMVEDRQHHCYWVVTRGAGIVRMTLEGGRCHTTLQPATMQGYDQSRGLSLLRDRWYGLFWCSAMDNLYAYSLGANGELERFPTERFLPPGNKILDQLYEDREGNIYVAGFTPHTFIVTPEQNGITRIDAPSIFRETGYPLLPERSVEEGKYIWIWQGRKGLLLYDTETGHFTISPWMFDLNSPVRRTAGGVYAARGKRVFRVWHDKGRTIRREELMSCPQKVVLLHEDRRQMLYVATANALYRLSPVSHLLEKVASLPAAPNDMEADRRGNVYLTFGTYGLYALSPQGAMKRVAHTGENFQALSVGTDGTVWCSTYEGNIYRYTPATAQINKEKFLCHDDGILIKDILVDNLGHVWTLTDQQVREYDPNSQAFRTIRNTDPFTNVNYFTRLEQSVPDHITIDATGALLQVRPSGMLGTQAMADIRPKVSTVLVNGRKILIGTRSERLTLRPDEKDVVLRLTTLNHRYAGNISFAYRLTDISHNWIYLPQGSNTVFLSNLPTGNHTLEVKATNRYGCWSTPVEVFSIGRTPHWYETWWAYLLYIGLSAALFYALWRLERRIRLLRRLIHRKQEMRLDEIEIKREEIADLHRNDEFLKSAIQKIEEHLGETGYNVEVLSSDLCMSRITLYRRMQEQTGQNPTDFIRDIRLKKAATLLNTSPDASVADIARKVGFSSSKYFSKCFKKRFGMLPKEYRQQGTAATPS